MAEQEILFRIRVEDDGSGTLAKLDAQLERLKKQRGELADKIKKGIELTAEEKRKYAELDAQMKTLNAQKRTYNQAVNNEIKLQGANKNSLAAMRAEVAKMRAEFEKLDPASEQSKRLAKEISDLQTKINQADFSTKNFRGNVGNYFNDIMSAASATKGLGGAIGGLGAVAGTVAGGPMMAVIGAIGLLQSGLLSGQMFGDKFAVTMGGLKGVTDSFRQALQTLDFSNLIGGMREAYEEGKRYAAMMDYLTDAQRSVDMQKKAIDLRIAELRYIMKNKSVDVEQRRAALEEIKQLEKQKLDLQLDVSNKAYENELTNISRITRQRKESIEDFVLNYTQYTDKIAQGQELLANLEKKFTREVQDMKSGYYRKDIDHTAMRKYIYENLNAEQWKAIQLARLEAALDDDKRERLKKAFMEQKDAQISYQQGLLQTIVGENTLGETTKRVTKEGETERLRVLKEQSAELKRQQEMEQSLLLELRNNIAAEEKRTELEERKREAYLRKLNAAPAKPEEDTEAFMTEEERKTEYAIKKTKETLDYKIAAIQQERIAEEEKNERIKALIQDWQMAKLYAVSNVMGSVAGLFRQETAAYKILSSAQAIIDTYAAATRALKLPFPMNWIQAAAVTAAGLANVARINGVKFQQGGIIEGPPHEAGGVPVKLRGGGYVEAEGGELIVNKNIWRRPDYVRAISEMNARTGGVRFYAAGGVLPPLGQVPDVNEAIERAIAGIMAIPVVVSERDITAMQRKVQVIDNITRI